MKSVRIRSFSAPYSPAFGLNTKRYGVFLRIQFEYGKILSRKTSHTDTFHAVALGQTELLRRSSMNTTLFQSVMQFSRKNVSPSGCFCHISYKSWQKIALKKNDCLIKNDTSTTKLKHPYFRPLIDH